MAIRTKTFDCVEMKRQAQGKLRAEFERRKGEFESIIEFINVKAQESELAKLLRSREQDA